MLTHADRAAGILLSHTSAVLLLAEHPWSLRYVVAFSGEGLVIAVPDRAVARATEAELHIPDESLEPRIDAAVAMVSVLEAEVSTVERIRWEAFHGEPPAERFAILQLQGVRAAGEVFDESELMLANPFAGEQALLCGRANQPTLLDAVEHHTHVRPEEVHVVGVDPLGIHIRGTFVVHRLEFPQRATDAEHALAMIDALLDMHP